MVPFGEYVPLRPVLGWIDKFVPIGGDFQPGRTSGLMTVRFGGVDHAIAPLICYEDIFPALARRSVRDGADVLAVLTNNAWYGEGGAAYQHAAHSVLRAVELRRPVLRVGNGGWSGWIDEFGNIRAELRRITRVNDAGVAQPVITTRPRDRDTPKHEIGTIYFRGSGVADVTRDARWIGRASFYVRHGDWFVLVSFMVFALAVALVKTGRVLAPARLSTDDTGS
ncbi:MAG TPA: apolipoprotein N-acyltransferase [Candidatus Synoicihabitans sp.]|nr:apolipoprotein N-acyltransferase [Candidatus Synoicihabitans sp.]